MKTTPNALLLLSLLFLASCKKDDNPLIPPAQSTNKLTVGTWNDAARQIISPSGGTIRISRAGDPLDGFELVVPPNGFTHAQDFTISYADIKSHRLGSHITPAA